MAIVNNPFIVGGYLSPHYFCDREVETEQLMLNSSCKCDPSLFYNFNFFLSCLIFLKVCASFGDKNPSLFLGL